jgi:D-glycero-alpha-D-manno-heptose-7-phosphate kinase
MPLCISKTPLRISFFGGGTDYPDYYNNRPGAVLGGSIDKYIHIVTLPMASFTVSRYHLTYRIVEDIDQIDQIQHPAIRAILRELAYSIPLNLAVLSDVPGGTGLGSSSAFTVGFLNLIYRLKGLQPTRYDLAKEAIRIEHSVLRENVGIQDQLHAAFGGLSRYTFFKDDFSITPIRMTTECRDALNASLVLVFTGFARHASTVVAEQVENTRAGKNERDLSHLHSLTEHGIRVLENTDPEIMLREFAEMLNDSWKTKRALFRNASSHLIDSVYEAGMSAGALGGKLCGAGGGGFFLFVVPPARHQKIKELFGEDKIVKIALEDVGSTILTG